MRKLIAFFWRHNVFLLFVLLELIGFALLVNYNTYHRVSFLSWTNEITGDLYSVASKVEERARLKEENIKLSTENALLRQQVKSAYLITSQPFQPLSDSDVHQAYQYVPAQIIDNNLSGQANFFMINQGNLAGIEKGMGVVNSTGVAGVITDVTAHYAVAMSVLNTSFQLGVRIKKNDFFGILSWNGRDINTVSIADIPGFVEVLPGDTVVTMGSEGLFPPDLTTAIITHVEKNEETGFLELSARLTTSLRNSGHVYVVQHLFRNEIDTLGTNNSEL